MVRALEEEKEILKSKLGQLKGIFEGGRHTRSMTLDHNGSLSPVADDRMASKSQVSTPLHDPEPFEQPTFGYVLDRTGTNLQAKGYPSDLDLMKEKFSKLLLGEDMSGGGKGVSSALALSNAITNLAASAFGEQKKLEPMAPDTKIKWRKEIDWLLSVTDHIVEFVPSKQKSKDGTSMEIMVTRQRHDLRMNVPALRKLDGMLLEVLDNFKDQNEFYYGSSKDDTIQKDKWWIPTPKVPPNGLSEVTRKWLQYQKDSVHQVLKAAMAINAQVLIEMDIPESYIEALPKNGRESLGDTMYKIITDDYFDPDYFLSSVDLSSEHKILELKNRIEASVEIWKRKMTTKDSKSSWGSGVSMEKREIFEDRAETILQILKHRFPGLPQSELDISKIQYNRDVGLAVLESYSRIIESLASTVLSRIDEVVQVDSLARNPSGAEQKMFPSPRVTTSTPGEDGAVTPTSKTLFDFMGWDVDNGGTEAKKDMQQDEAEHLSKPSNMITNRKLSYIERLENLGAMRSPTARQ